MTAEARIRYRKLPGRLRGFIRGAGVWQGPDHLLLVNSMRFREEYRRFYFKDVQAIAIAKAPRFHVSTRVVPLLILGPVAFGYLYGRGFPLWPWFLAAALLLAAWVIVSAQFSCRCCIYTAVSGEELRSVYRTWTARRFLARVEPLIAQAQGAVDPNWAQTVADRWWTEGRGAGPAEAASPPEATPPAPATTPRRGFAGAFFAAALLFSGIFDFATLHVNTTWAVAGPGWFAALKIAAATIVFIQFNRGAATRALRRLAIAALIVIGVMFYANQFTSSMQIAFSQHTAIGTARPKSIKVSTAILARTPLLRGIEGGADILLGLLSAVFMIQGGSRP